MNIINRIFTAFETRAVPPCWNLFRTLYFNFRVLPFSQAIKLPIFIYGKVKFPILAGHVEISSPLKKGMIKIGRQDPFCVSSGQGFIAISTNAKIIFEGPTHISTNCCIRVFAGELKFGKYILLGSDVKVICNGSHIVIGDYSRIAFDTVIMNSGFHSVVNLETKKVGRHTRPIEIGAKTWCGNKSTISGGAKLKTATIIGAGSFVNKDYSETEGKNQMIGGRPAKVIKTGLARIFSPVIEQEIMDYLSSNPNESTFTLQESDEDMTELEKEFK